MRCRDAGIFAVQEFIDDAQNGRQGGKFSCSARRPGIVVNPRKASRAASALSSWAFHAPEVRRSAPNPPSPPRRSTSSGCAGFPRVSARRRIRVCNGAGLPQNLFSTRPAQLVARRRVSEDLAHVWQTTRRISTRPLLPGRLGFSAPRCPLTSTFGKFAPAGVLRPWHSKLGRLVKSRRCFIRDSDLYALLNLGASDDVRGHGVAQELGRLRLEHLLPPPRPAPCPGFTQRAGAEADLVLEFSPGVAGIEIKLSTAPKVDRGFHFAADDIKAERRFSLSGATSASRCPAY